MSERSWPPQSAKIHARAALAALPDALRPHYVAHYVLMGARYGEFAGLVCAACNRWREYGHEPTCRVRRYELGYRWRPRRAATNGRKRRMGVRR